MKNPFSIYDDSPNIEVFPEGKLFRISFDSTLNRMRLRCFNFKEMDEIMKVYSDVNPASFFMKQYGYNVDNRLYVVNKFGYFPSGFFFELVKYIKRQYGSTSVIALSDNTKRYISERLIPLKKTLEGKTFKISNVSEDSGRNVKLEEEGKNPFLFRDYQEESIRQLIFGSFGRGFIELGTSAGKSFIIGNFIYNLQKNVSQYYKAMILVPNKQLVYQMYNDLIDYGFKPSSITKFTAGLKKNEKYDPNAKVIIANRQYVFTNMKLLPKINILFVDEIHTTLAERTRKCIEQINSEILVGCTGTVPKGNYDRWSINGIYGPLAFSKPMTELQNEGYVSKLRLYEVKIIDSVVENDRNYLFHTRPLKHYSPDENGYSEIPFNAAHDAEHEYYEQYYKELYTPALEYISEFDENTLILFDRIEFGKRLTELAKTIFKNKKVHYIDGSVPVQERLDITSSFEKDGNNVLFAEFATFQVGISIKRLTNIAFVSSSKSFPRIAQSIGRTLRLHKTKDYARVFDIHFNFKYSQRHYIERLKIYKELYNKTPDEKKVIII